MVVWLDKHKKLLTLLLDVLLLAAFAFVKPLIAVSKVINPVCPFRLVLRMGCPVCGGTHAIEAMLQGHMGTALSYNAFVFALGAYLLSLLVLLNSWVWISSQKAKKLLWKAAHYKVIVAFGVLAWVYALGRHLFYMVV